MSFIDSVKTCFDKYFWFQGRASRSEFFYFLLFLALVHLALIMINSAIYGPEITATYRLDQNGQPVGDPIDIRRNYNSGWLGNIFMFLTFVPWVAVGWRRMHDSGRAGYWPWVLWIAIFVSLVLFIASKVGFGAMIEALKTTGRVQVQSTEGTIVFVVAALGAITLNLFWLTRPSDTGPNRYGANPLDPLGIQKSTEVFK